MTGDALPSVREVVTAAGHRLDIDPGELMALTLELAAHDLRGPLASSRAAVGRLLRSGSSHDPDLLEALAETLASVERMVGDLLGIGLLDRTRCDEPVALDEVVTDCVASCSDPDAVDQVTVATRVAGDRVLLKAAIGNLIENALRYRSSRVLVQSGPVRRGGLVVVDDDGPGVPPAMRDAVFHPLVRLEPHVADGAGLGLALVRRVAELHDGRAWVEGKPSPGARFCLQLLRP